MFCVICTIATVYVTRFAKRGLIHAQFQDAPLATSMYQQHMCLIPLKVEKSAVSQAFFSSMSDIHECSGGL